IMIIGKKNFWSIGVCAFWVMMLPVLVMAQELRTTSEQADFEVYTSYDEMMDYLQEVQAGSTEMLLGSYGKTLEGLESPYMVFSRPMITKPTEAHASGKPVILVASNIHGNERTIREGVLILVRQLATPGTDMNRLLDDLVIVVVPSINPDGFVRNTRGNALGLDLNRDYIKQEQPTLQNFVQNIIQPWTPHVFLEGHNGGAYPYNVTYQGPTHAGSDQRLTDLCDQELFPFVKAELEANGFKGWYYGSARGDYKVWNAAPFEPRFSYNYAGLINCIGVLYEAPGQSRSDGALSGLVACRALLKYCARNPEKIKEVVARAKRRTIMLGQNARGEFPVQMEVGPKDYKVSYEVSEGQGEDRKLIQITDGVIMIEPIATKTRPRPYAYILEERAARAIQMLRRHNITVEVLQEETKIEIEAYQMTGIEHRAQYDHP
ncbi:MAG: DUF2817 domain-containing protein, partial [Planctomycetes bacterium]|nr:DUF2817 domain-containing protein [Planctomycetota bacterium]